MWNWLEWTEKEQQNEKEVKESDVESLFAS